MWIMLGLLSCCCNWRSSLHCHWKSHFTFRTIICWLWHCFIWMQWRMVIKCLRSRWIKSWRSWKCLCIHCFDSNLQGIPISRLSLSSKLRYSSSKLCCSTYGSNCLTTSLSYCWSRYSCFLTISIWYFRLWRLRNLSRPCHHCRRIWIRLSLRIELLHC